MSVSPAELDRFADLLEDQRDHLRGLAGYSEHTCRNTRGMHGLMSPLNKPLQALADEHEAVLRNCTVGLTDDAIRVKLAAGTYHTADEQAALDLDKTFPSAPRWFPELDTGSPRGFRQAYSVAPKEPGRPDTDIGEQVQDMKGVLGTLDWIYEKAEGYSLVELLLEPLTGNYGRITYLAEAYDSQATAAYHTAWNIRSGTAHLVAHWDGEASREFEYRMFRWHMGIGGLADLDKVISQALHLLHEKLSAGVGWVLGKIQELIEKILLKLANPLRKIKYLPPWKWDDFVKDHYELFQRARDIVREIEHQIRLMKEAVEEILSRARAWINLLNGFTRDPVGTARGLAKEAYMSGLTFEKRGWDARLGAHRVALLPIRF